MIAAGLRQEQRFACPAQARPVREIVRQQHPGRSRIRHDPLEPVLRRLRPDPQGAVGRVEIVGAQRAQLLTAQRGIVGQGEHHAVADGLHGGDGQDVRPLLLGGNPRQLRQPGHQPALIPAAPSAGREAAPTNGIGLAQPLLHEVVVEQPHRHQPLRNGGAGQPGSGIEGHHIRATAAGPVGQLPHIDADMRPARRERVDTLPLAHLQILGKPPCVGVDRPRRPPEIGPHPQPPGRPHMPAQHRPLLLQHHRAVQAMSSVPWSTPRRHDHPHGQIPRNFQDAQTADVRARKPGPSPQARHPHRIAEADNRITKSAPDPISPSLVIIGELSGASRSTTGPDWV